MKLRKFDDLGKGDYGWLQTSYHFSFANYYDPNHVRVGPLRVLNDDYVKPFYGFDTHPHNDMEIITYVISGTLTHEDSMGNVRELGSGGVQYMSAGTGVRHSEHNKHDKELHLFQTWIIPNQKGLTPNYGDMEFSKEDRKNKLLHIVSSKDGEGKIHINQNASIYVGEFDKDQLVEITLDSFSKFYLVLISGEIHVDELKLEQGDSLQGETDFTIEVKEDAHLYLVKV